jgi:hypothetical protein
MALTRTKTDERRSARRSELIVRLLRVYRAAAIAVAGLEPVGRGVYRPVPGDVTHLRQKLDEAKELINEEGVIGCP